MTQDEAVELQGGSEREKEKLERGGEEWELVVVEEEQEVQVWSQDQMEVLEVGQQVMLVQEHKD